mmetsp:Transcript_13462/g.43629  ORF Transcript_13462/g.43629 Transcript_13462/m.43629 type:complete len:350 (-) Transcript_13462:39-1088(-)
MAPSHVMVWASRRHLPLLFCCIWAWLPSALARTVSVPDLHGDFERGVLILEHAGLIDPARLHDEEHPLWIGGTTSLVQTGDMVDRGDHGKELYLLFQRLQKEAKAAGGQVINLLGNHELMNIQEDLRYVSDGDYADFGGPTAREEAWAEHGWLGSWVRTFPAVAKVDNVLFSHAGLPLKFLEGHHTLEDINDGMAMAVAPNSFLETHSHTGDKALAETSSLSSRELMSDGGPLWTRFYAKRGDPVMCRALDEVLELVGAKRMVVGHTIQFSPGGGFRVRADCGGRLLLADTAVSRAYKGNPSYVEHDGQGGAVAVYPLMNLRQPLPLVPSNATSQHAPSAQPRLQNLML